MTAGVTYQDLKDEVTACRAVLAGAQLFQAPSSFSVLSSIDAIYKLGSIHNDIKKENILVDENGMVYLIDFGFATLNSCKDAQQDERNQLLKCIECL